MKRRHKVLLGIATVGAVVAKGAAYAASAKAGDAPLWLSNWAIGAREELGLAVFLFATASAVTEGIRGYLGERHEFKRVLAHLLDDCAKHTSNERQKKNRLTVFKVTRGWRSFLWGLVRLPLTGRRSKWRVLFRLKWSHEYLGVYLRPAMVRNRYSVTALHVSDYAPECEGMAGLVYEEGFCLIGDLPAVTREDVAAVQSLDGLPSQHAVRRYAEATRIKDIALLRSFDNFARHFIGIVIRRSDGTPWGVLLIDSEEENCPFPLPSGGGMVRDKLESCARLMGKIVS